MDSNEALILRAALFAADKHRDQRRKDVAATPYINHPLALASLLATEGGVEDAEILAAALLHDTIEDTETDRRMLAEAFGERVASIVGEVTDDKVLPQEVRKQLQIDHGPHLSREAKLVKLADKICNVRDVLQQPPKEWGLEQRRTYIDWAAKVVDGIRGTHARLESLFDRALAARP